MNHLEIQRNPCIDKACSNSLSFAKFLRNFMKFRLLLPILATFLTNFPAQALILYGEDNSANQTDPGTGLPFDSVAKISDGLGGNVSGTGIYLGNGYMLTANHVNNRSHVTFDGSTFHEWDSAFTPVQIGSTDMKIFKLSSDPGVSGVLLYGGNNELSQPGNIVGWGVGRNPSVPVETNSVAWGDSTTEAKRWDENTVEGFSTASDSTYTYTAFNTVAGSPFASPAGLGANEAAVTLNDSGSGFFQKIGGVWYLTGLTTSVETLNTTNFGADQNLSGGSENYFVRISAYQTQIALLVPEPGSALLTAITAIGLISRRRRL